MQHLINLIIHYYQFTVYNCSIVNYSSKLTKIGHSHSSLDHVVLLWFGPEPCLVSRGEHKGARMKYIISVSCSKYLEQNIFYLTLSAQYEGRKKKLFTSQYLH
jgi:hypothetical protein